MLEYENQAFLEIFEEDGLVIIAKGLGLEEIFCNLMKTYCEPENLVLVLGTTLKEQQYFIEQFERDENVTTLPKIINSESGSTKDRESIYHQGGVLFITPRILIVDMLSRRIPIELINGILIYRAHKVNESGQEAFILRLFREKNKTGFIKAFSDSAYAFTKGFCQVERVMRNLFVKKLYLWPRFHITVNSSLEKNKVDVIEIHVKMTSAMTNIQMSLLDLISVCIKELKNCNPSLDIEEFTVENTIAKSFDKIVRLQLDPIWNQLTVKTRQLVSDLKLLRTILHCLTQYDSVTFYNYLSSLRSNAKAFQEYNWVILESAEALFSNAKLRVFRGASKSRSVSSSDKSAEKPNEEFLPEENPKWLALTSILKEIEEEVKSSSRQNSILILTKDEATQNQLQEYILEGAQALLKKSYKKTLAIEGAKAAPKEKVEMTNKKPKKAEEDKQPKGDALTLTQMLRDDTDMFADNVEPEINAAEELLRTLIPQCIMAIQPVKSSDNPFGLAAKLASLQPRFVIVYDAEMSCTRLLEIHKARSPDNELRVYFLLYTGSVEEQCYLTVLRREKEAFELLIRQKAAMVIPEEQHGKTDNHPLLDRNPMAANQTVNAGSSRQGGGAQQTSEVRQIIVDMREFGSELPSLIHRRGIDIVPVTLEVGDYILTPDICVERKSVSDLIGSLNNGRLYNQALAMTRYYSQPVLLIEFDQNKPFSLQSQKKYLPDEVSSHDSMSKLLLLTIHFPRLRLLWCSSPYATAELFDELKSGKVEPDVEAALAVTAAMKAHKESDPNVDKYNPAPHDLLMKLPGVNSKNCFSLLNSARNLVELTSTKEEKLNEILGNSANAKNLWAGMNLPITQLDNAATSFNSKTSFKNRKRRR